MYLNLFSSATAQEYRENPFQVIDVVVTITALTMKCSSVCLLHLACNHTELQVINEIVSFHTTLVAVGVLYYSPRIQSNQFTVPLCLSLVISIRGQKAYSI